MHTGLVSFRRIASVVLVSLGAVGTASTAYAAFPLILKNNDSIAIRATLSTDDNNCYEGSPPLGEIMDIPPHGQYRMVLSRVGGHGCDGRQGEFTVTFKPAPPGKTDQHFDFSNDNELELTPGRANPYPGRLVKNGDGSYTYAMYARPAITAGPVIGRWSLICQSICSNSAAVSQSITKTSETSENEEVTRAVAVSLEGGVEFKGISAKTSVTMSEEKKIGHSMSESLTNGETFTETRNFVFTPEQMKSLNIFAVWQWVASAPLSDGHVFTLGSNKVTCTPDAQPPSYLPGSPEDLRACRGG